MSSFPLKNEMTEDLLVCRACLGKNKKLLFSIQQTEICQAYRNLVGCEVTPYDTYPQYICNYCTSLLKKFNAFREQCQQSRRYLEDARIRNNPLPTNFAYPQLNKSEIYIISLVENAPETNDLKTDYFEPYDDINNQTKDLPSPTVNLKIYTDEIKIENDINVKDKKRKLKSSFEAKDKNIKTYTDEIKIAKKKSKGTFEMKDNLKDFEIQFDVDITILTKEEQIKDLLDRKLSCNYLSSPYKCEMCYKGFMGVDLLKKHVLTQHDPSRGNVVCEFCRFRYKDRRGLNQHLKSHRLKFACKQCSYVSRTTFNAKEHFKMHGGQLHECRHCGKCYEKLSSHLTHLRIQHPSEFIWCDVCGEAFIGSFGLNAHKKRAHRYLSLPSICTSCDKRFADTTALNRHLSTDSCNGHTCVHCGEMFKQALDLRDHLLNQHRSYKIYACEKCDKTFSRQSLYSAHYRRIHVSSEERGRRKEKPWVCEVCGKTLPNKCMLLYHQRNHTGEKPYQCTQCSKSFTMKKLLQSHLRVHSSDRPYACRLCPKTFKGLSALRAHEKIHTSGQDKSSRHDTIK